MSMRADRLGCAGTFRSVKIPPTWVSSRRAGYGGTGYADKFRARTPASAQVCSLLQAPAATAERCAPRPRCPGTPPRSRLCRRARRVRFCRYPPRRLQSRDHQSACGGKVAIAEQGMEMSSARGAPDTSGAVIWVTCRRDRQRYLVAIGRSRWSASPEATGQRPQQQAHQPGDDGDQPRDPLRSLITVVGHEVDRKRRPETCGRACRRASLGADCSCAIK